MRKLGIIALFIIYGLFSCGYSPSPSENTGNLKLNITLPSEKGEFLYDVKVTVDSIDMNSTTRKWDNLSGGAHTLTMEVPPGKDRIFEVIVFRDIAGTEYPIYSATGKVNINDTVSVNVQLKKLFQVTGIFNGTTGTVVAGQYPLKTSFTEEINGDGVHPPIPDFTDIWSRYLISDKDEHEYTNDTKVILKDFIFSSDLKIAPLFFYNRDLENVTENFYIPSLDFSSLQLISPFGLSGYTSSLYSFDGSNYTMYLLSENMSKLEIYSVNLEYANGTPNTTISEIAGNTTIYPLSSSDLSNRTCYITAYFQNSYFPLPTPAYKGYFEPNQNVNRTIIFPEYGSAAEDGVMKKTFAIDILPSVGNFTVTTTEYQANETVNDTLYLAVLGIDKLFSSYPSATYLTALNGTELRPVISYNNPDGYSSLIMKIATERGFNTIAGNLTASGSFSDLVTGDYGNFEAITKDGRYVKIKTPIFASSPFVNFNLQEIYKNSDLSVAFAYNSDTNIFKLLIKSSDTALTTCNIDFLEDKERAFFPYSEQNSPIREYYIFKGALLPTASYKNIPLSPGFLKGNLPPETKYIKVSCRTSNGTFEVGRVYTLAGNSIVPTFSFPDITGNGTLTVAVNGENMTISTSWSNEGQGIIIGNDKIETLPINGTVPIHRIINMAPAATIYGINYKLGEKKAANININVVNSTTAVAIPYLTGFDIPLTWNSTNFESPGTCVFNIIDSEGGYANATWNMDYTTGIYDYNVPSLPDYVYVTRFCTLTDGNYTIITKIVKPLY